MKKNKTAFITVILCIAATAVQAAGILYVDAASPNNPGSGTFEDPFRKIQDGINSAMNGDIVQINPGIYSGTGNYDLDPQGKSITICSRDPNNPDVTAQTIIDPNQAGRGFYIHSSEDPNCVILGLTIKNAYTAECGAGIYCQQSSPTITNCILRDNHAEIYGGAICCDAGNPQVKNCIITNNTGRYGGGFGCFTSSEPSIINCTIAGNTAIFSGGGVFCDMNSHVVINSSILWANKLDYPEENYGPQICLFEGSSASVSYSDIQGGQEEVGVVESTLYWLSGNIYMNPLFAAFDPNESSDMWDVHLQSTEGRWDGAAWRTADFSGDGFVDLEDFAMLASVWLQEGEGLAADIDGNNSVDLSDLQIMLNFYLAPQPMGMWVKDAGSSICLDAGDAGLDWTAESWPNGKRVNMGAYGGTSQASRNGNIADFDVSGKVDITDFELLARTWDKNIVCIEDLNNNGNTELADLAIFADNWLWEKE